MVATRRCLAGLLILAASCARSSTSMDTEPNAVVSEPRAPRYQNVISKEELQDPAIQSLDALKVIEQLRPAFLRPNPPQSFFIGNAGVTQMSEDFGPLQPLSQLKWVNVLMLYE